MCWIRPKSDDIMSVVGNQDVFMIEEKEMMGNTMIKLKGFKEWFNLNDFEVLASPTPKSATQTSLNPDIKRNLKRGMKMNKCCSRCENLENCTIELSLQDENPDKFVCDNFVERERDEA